MYQAKWTTQIIGELTNALLRDREDLTTEQMDHLAERLSVATRDCLVEGYEALIPSFELPDPHDRHVLAAAVRAGAQVIVTANLKDFPEEELAPFGIEAQSADDFVLFAIDLNQAKVVGAIHEQAAALKSPPLSADELLDALEACGLVQSVVALRALLA